MKEYIRDGNVRLIEIVNGYINLPQHIIAMSQEQFAALETSSGIVRVQGRRWGCSVVVELYEYRGNLYAQIDFDYG